VGFTLMSLKEMSFIFIICLQRIGQVKHVPILH